ncbi:hypothetical protein ACQ86O_13690 [Serratia sp. L9]|uniref:hypothetical protein n=1 Tax=Serratia sp. L9 TaxID=3423946 RepID=UPI003D66F926
MTYAEYVACPLPDQNPARLKAESKPPARGSATAKCAKKKYDLFFKKPVKGYAFNTPAGI